MFCLVNSAVNRALPTVAAERRAVAPCCGAFAAGRMAPAVVDQYLLTARRSAANPPHAAATDRRTDGRTPDRYIDPAPRTIRAMSTDDKYLFARRLTLQI